ncbi:MAG: Eco57I restriction-modification methylase domain-containing protein, partial [Thermomicrobiales bacterium]
MLESPSPVLESPSPVLESPSPVLESPAAEGPNEGGRPGAAGEQPGAEGGRFKHRPYGTRGTAPRHFDSMDDLLMRLDAPLCRALLLDILPSLSILDPACGSGAFLVAAMKTLIPIYSAVVGKIHFLNDATLTARLREIESHPSPHYFIKKEIISRNLFGVDIMEEAAEIAQLRLYLALVSSVRDETQLEPLPNIDFNLLTGNSLIGLLKVDEAKYPATLFYSYKDVVRQKNDLIAAYRDVARPDTDLRALRDDIQAHRDEAAKHLNDLLLDDWKRLRITYEQATWDAAKQKEGKPTKRALTVADIARLRPFHWGYEFDGVLNERGGFDAIITNPPWEIFKPQAKEFFAQYSALVSKNKMTIKEFEEHQTEALRDAEMRAAWLEYLSAFPYQSMYYRSAPQYKNQISVIGGKKAGTDINLYKLFTEQCYNLLREGGQCGIVIPSGIYTDLGTKQLRELLFGLTRISGLFCFENRRMIFEGVDSRFKFIVLTYGKGGRTDVFPAAFMRHEVAELDRFPQEGALDLSVELIRRLSPDSLSVMEFKNEMDVRIAEKMLRFPLLGEKIEGTWNLVLTNEFHMTNDSHLFQTAPGPGRLPLFTGKMFNQFLLTDERSGYWIDEKAGRTALRGKREDSGQPLDYQGYRWVHRRIARDTDSRTMISTITPKNVFTEVNSTTIKVRETGITDSQMLCLCALMNSFSLDWMLRHKVNTTLNMFYIYQLPVPRLTERDAAFAPIVERAARLICTTPEFDDLARAGGLRGHADGATDPAERDRLRAELDGIVAHLYGLTDEEFAHILATFPLVPQATKDAALAAYRALAPIPGDTMIADLIARRESGDLEFKQSVRWDIKEKTGEKVFVKEIASFMNAKGGMLLIGVADDGAITGLDADYATLSEKMGRDRDGYERFLTSLLSSRLGAENAALSTITFHTVNGTEVCRVVVQPAAEEVWVKEGAEEIFYLRIGNKSEPLRGPALTRYARTRWP